MAPEHEPRLRLRPRSLRSRLTAAFILVAFATGALLVGTTYVLVRHYRVSTFERRSETAARLALLSAPEELTDPQFEDLLIDYQERGAIDGLWVVDATGRERSSLLDTATVENMLDDQSEDADLVSLSSRVDGHPYLIVAGEHGGARYAFAFSEQQLFESITETRDLLLIGWVAATLVAAVLGQWIARRTLAPVRDVADASHAIAEGMLETRLDGAHDDEFGRLASSFNEMAEALAAKIDQLSDLADRERRFTANVAHDLRTPLTGMASAASLLETKVADLPVEMRRPLTLLLEDVDRLQRLVVDLLELSRHDAGQETVSLEPIVIRDAVGAVVAGSADPDRIDTRLDDDLLALGDRRRFGRVLDNLVGNALVHTEGPIEVAARQQAGRVHIDVLDRGPGLGDGDLSLLFDRFYKADPSRSTSGSGLGLSIARENARLQGGDVIATPRAGGGACFTLTLPADGTRQGFTAR
ncbi:MAG: HAMP domain-containing histidine kinase [Acidimicrobiales bacterium]|nr:HAMP domain-containing histidine kinase [Acidimicrobiales bacterium]